MFVLAFPILPRNLPQENARCPFAVKRDSTASSGPVTAPRAWAIQRFSRLTNAFTNKIENHAHAVALHYMHHDNRPA
jgi:hypothetical protein